MDKHILGKEVKVILDDLGRATPKQGKAISEDEHFFIIESEKGIEGIPFNRIIRVEVLI